MKLILVSLLLFACFSQNGCKDPSCISGDCANGEGTWLAKDGSKYVGQWKNGKMDGLGRYMYPDGTVYDGGWKNGKINGQGTWVNPEGLKYEGEWKDDMMNGQGILISPDGKVHEGEWHHGEFRVPLNVSSLSGDTANEEFLAHEELKVQETLSLSNDKTYDSQPGVEREILTYPINTEHAVIPGEEMNNEKESIIPPGDPKNEDQTIAEPAYGRDTYIYPDGGKYEGDWKDGKRNGRGIYTYPDGGIYEGQWSDGKETVREHICILTAASTKGNGKMMVPVARGFSHILTAVYMWASSETAKGTGGEPCLPLRALNMKVIGGMGNLSKGELGFA